MTHHSDPRTRRHHGAFAPPVDALAAAVRLDLATADMRAQTRAAGPAPVPAPADPLDDEPPTSMLDLNAIRAALAAGPIAGERVDPAAAAWLAGSSRSDAAAVGRIVEQLDQLDQIPVAAVVEEQPEPEQHCAECHPELFRARCADGGCYAAEPAAVSVAEPAPVDVGPRGAVPAPPAHITSSPGQVFSSERGRVLDWVSRHDPRSLAYAARDLFAGSAPLTDHVWPIGGVLDQGAEGACVGFGITDALNAERAGDADRTAADALALYHAAQRVDEIPGEDYSGTSVLAGLKAAKAAGLIGGYRWCFGTKDIAQTVLQAGPVVIGIPWLAGMYETGPGGLVKVTGADRGEGHCLAVVGLRLKGPQGQAGPFFVWLNSWGTTYGDRGLGYVHHKDLAALLHGAGEAALPIVGTR